MSAARRERSASIAATIASRWALERIRAPTSGQIVSRLPTTTTMTQATYQRGSGLTEAQGLWLCAWEQEWLAQRGNDKARAAAALEQLRAAPALEYMTKYLDQVGKDLLTNALAQANEGNADGFELDAELNCND
jgi:hypothetical protein